MNGRKRRIKFIVDTLGLNLIPNNKCKNWNDYKKNSTKNFQPGLENESQIVETLAKKFGCNNFYTNPNKFIKFLERFKIKSTNVRYCYSNHDNTTIIFQGGNPHFVDIVYGKQKYILCIECKNKIGKTKEYDLLYNENGKIINYENVISEIPSFKQIIEKFNNETSIFNILGHNYKIIGNGEILSSYFANKKVDILIVVKNNKLFCIDAITDLDFIKILDSSEIRSCGKNNYKLFTPKHFNSNFDIKKITTSYARMGNKMNVNRYKMLGIYFVRKLTDFIPKPNINSIRQNKATISLHFTINKTLEELQDYYNSRI